MVYRSLTVLETLSEVHKVKTYFIMTVKIIFLFHWVDICTDGAKAVMGSTADAFAPVKAMAPNCTS